MGSDYKEVQGSLQTQRLRYYSNMTNIWKLNSKRRNNWQSDAKIDCQL